MTEPSRRFPTPWHADKVPGGYVVRGGNKQALVWVYSRDGVAEAMQAKCDRIEVRGVRIK